MAGTSGGEVLLVTMPFGPLGRPSLGLTLLKGGLKARGVSAQIRYWTVRYAEICGAELYERITEFPDMTALLGEWLFSPALVLEGGESEANYLDHVLDIDRSATSLIPGANPSAVRARLQELRGAAARFVESCARDVLRVHPPILGITSTFQQHVASLGLAARVKALAPDIVTVFGGANCEGPMGIETLRQFPYVDFVISGEGDAVFPELVESVLGGVEPPPRPGLYVGAKIREGGGVPSVAAPVANLDDLPWVDYDDYLDQWRGARFSPPIPPTPTMLFETSRGCWWGERHHCTFCGLNGQSMTFRSKSQGRALSELAVLRRKYPECDLAAVDNILDVKYFDEFIPALSKGATVELFYEVKANLRKDQIAALARAGITRVQPGIESLSTKILSLMRKGVTAIQNVQFLKWCLELGVSPSWNIISGFPGEPPKEYERMSELVPLISHLPPPDGMGRIRLDRFSPYFEDPAGFGLRNVRPAAAYRYVYALPEDVVSNLAYCFEYDYQEPREPGEYTADLDRRVSQWQREGPHHVLAMTETRTDLVIFDGRRIALAPVVRLSGLYRRLYLACDRARALPGLARDADVTAEARATPERIEAVLSDLVARRLVMSDGGYFLSLAVAVGDGYQPPFDLLGRAPRRAGGVKGDDGAWRIPEVESLTA